VPDCEPNRLPLLLQVQSKLKQYGTGVWPV
jgi:hypothetical protein